MYIIRLAVVRGSCAYSLRPKSVALDFMLCYWCVDLVV